MMTAMIAAQVVGAVPIAAAGRPFGVSAWMRALFAFRALAFGALLLAIVGGAPITILVIAAGLAGLVNGSIFGLLRAVLNEMVTSTKLPRALGVAATANELVAVGGPIAASTIGGVSVIAAVGNGTSERTACRDAPAHHAARTGGTNPRPTRADASSYCDLVAGGMHRGRLCGIHRGRRSGACASL